MDTTMIRYFLIMMIVSYSSSSVCSFAHVKERRTQNNGRIMDRFDNLSDDNKIAILNCLQARNEYIDIPGAHHKLPMQETTEDFVANLIASICGNDTE